MIVIQKISENPIITGLFLTGFLLFAISAILFGSVYEALITGLTLTSVKGDELTIKLGNITGAIGGILIFFVSLSLVFQYILLVRRRDEKIREAANRYLDRMEK
jgi:uncharacterized protein with PQ loop repeat